MLALTLALMTLLPDGPFHDLDFEDALAKAKAEDKVVMIDFFTTWCAPCKQLDATTWKDTKVTSWLDDKTVALKLDAEIETDLAKRYEIAGYPTMIFLRADGTELGRIVGYRDAETFLETAASRAAGKSEVDELNDALVDNPGDMMVRMRRGDALARERRYAEALEEYLACFDQGRDSPGFAGVRLSFLLGSIVRLGEAHPPALDALASRAEALDAKVLAGTASYFDMLDMTALYNSLGHGARNLEVFDLVRADPEADAQLVQLFFDRVLDQLIEAERFQDVIDFAGDPMERVEKEIDQFEMLKAFATERAEGDEMLATMRELTVDKAEPWFRAYLGVEQDEKAIAIALRMVEFDTTAATAVRFSRLARGAKRYDTAAAIIDRAGEVVDEEQHDKLAKERKRIDRRRK